MEYNAARNSPEANPPAAEEKSGWNRVRSVVLRWGWNVGKKVAIVGTVVSSAPVVIPPLLFFSTLGFAVAFPFGVYFASFACTDLLMRSLLGPPNGEQEEEEEEEFFVPEEEIESEGDKEEEEIVWQLEIEEKGNEGMVEEEEKQREEAGMGEGMEVVEDKMEEERGGGMFPYDVNLVPLVLVYPDDKYSSEVYDGWNRGDIATEEQLMEEMKMREEIQVENEKDQEILVSSQYPAAAETGGEEKTEEEVGGGEQIEAEAEVKEEVGLDGATLKSEESLRSDDKELEQREAKVAPSSEYASDAKGGGDRGDVGLAGKERYYGGGGEMLEEQQVTEGVGLREERDEEDKKEEEESVGTAACETEGLLSSSSIVTVMPEAFEPNLEHENKIKQSTLSLEYVLALEKGYEGAVGIMEEEELIEEVELEEAYTVEKGYEVGLIEAHDAVEKGYQGNLGIGEEKLTEEVAFGDAFEVEKAYERDVDILQEKKQTEVGSGEAHILEVKGYGGDVGVMEGEKLTEDVGLGEAIVVEEKYEGSVGIMDGEKPTEEVGLGEACTVEEKRYEGDVGVMEEGKPIEKVRLGEAIAVGEKRCEVDVGIIEKQKSTGEVGFGEAYATERKGYEGDVGTMDEGKLIEEEGLEEVCAVEEKVYEGDVSIIEELKPTEVVLGEATAIEDTAALESGSGYASVTALLEVHRVETEPSLELACDVKNSGNIRGIGLLGEETLLEEMVKREEKGTKENEYRVGAAAQGFSQSVCPSVGVVLEEHVDQVKQSNSSSESASVVKKKGHEAGVEMIEEKKPTESMDVGEEIEKEEGKEYDDDGEGIGIKLVEYVQPTKETLMEERQEAGKKVMKQEGVGSENNHQLQIAEHFFVDVVSVVQNIETEQSGMSLCYSFVVKQNESGGHIQVLEENILQSDEAGMKEEREVLVGGKEGEGDSVADPKNDEAPSNVDDVAVASVEIMVESEPSSFNSEYVSAVEYQSLDMAETESRSSIEHGLDLRPGLKVVAVDTQVPVSSDDEDLYSENMLWEQIFAIRTIMGYKAALHLSPIEELKALFLFTGVNPPASMKDDSDLMELNEKLQFLKSVIGIQ